jgi:hypothetical protein
MKPLSLRSNYKYYIVIVLVVLFSVSFVAVLNSEQSMVQWQKTYFPTSDMGGIDLAQTSDGGYITLAMNTTHYNRGVGETPILLKMSSNGGLQWVKTFTDIGWPRKVVQASDLGYVIFSGKCVTKTDAQGNIQWKNFNFNNVGIQTSDGGYAFLSENSLSKTDNQFNILWNDTFLERSNENIQTHQTSPDIFFNEAKDGGFIITGSWGYNAWLCKIDAKGNILLNRIYDKDTLFNQSYSFDVGNHWSYPTGTYVFQTVDNGYVILGSFKAGYSSISATWIAKTDSGGNLQWVKESDVSAHLSVVQTDDGGYIAVGENRYATITKYDEFGKEVWSANFGSGETEQGSDSAAACVIKTSDGGYAVTGDLTINKNDNIVNVWLIKFYPENHTLPQTEIILIDAAVVAATVSAGLFLIYFLKKHQNKQR